MTIYDIAIIGSGPAGLSAGITARARNKSTVIISNKPQESPLAKSTLLDNYPGMPGVSGLELLTKMIKHADRLGCEFVNARVITVLPLVTVVEGEEVTSFSITTSGDVIDARSVILALGASSGGKSIEGEKEFLGRGVSYCASCDGMFFRNATVCVIALNSEAADEAEFLAEIGAKVHYLVPKRTMGQKASQAKASETATPEENPLEKDRSANDAITKDLPVNDAITVHVAKVIAIEGGMLGVTGVRVKEELDKAGSPSEETVIDCQGVFILRPTIAPTSLLATLALEGGYIEVDARMCTNVAGIFAAGDCTGKPLQVAKAVGEGQVACFSAVEYLDAHR